MDYKAEAERWYQEMCRLVGDVVFTMMAEGHETKRVAITDVLRTEIAKGDKNSGRMSRKTTGTKAGLVNERLNRGDY